MTRATQKHKHEKHNVILNMLLAVADLTFLCPKAQCVVLSAQVSPAVWQPVMANADSPGPGTVDDLNLFCLSMGVTQSVSESFFECGRVLKCFILNVISVLALQVLLCLVLNVISVLQLCYSLHNASPYLNIATKNFYV